MDGLKSYTKLYSKLIVLRGTTYVVEPIRLFKSVVNGSFRYVCHFWLYYFFLSKVPNLCMRSIHNSENLLWCWCCNIPRSKSQCYAITRWDDIGCWSRASSTETSAGCLSKFPYASKKKKERKNIENLHIFKIDKARDVTSFNNLHSAKKVTNVISA